MTEKTSWKYTRSSIILFAKITIPIFLISSILLQIFFSSLFNLKNVFIMAFLVSVWAFYNIITIFNIEFYSTNYDIDTNQWQDTKVSSKNNTLSDKIWIFIFTTLMIGYVIYNIVQKALPT